MLLILSKSLKGALHNQAYIVVAFNFNYDGYKELVVCYN